jgi:hypothetical protein
MLYAQVRYARKQTRYAEEHPQALNQAAFQYPAEKTARNARYGRPLAFLSPESPN